MEQRELEKGEGPIVVIVAPTHELAEQIHREACVFERVWGMGVSMAWYGIVVHKSLLLSAHFEEETSLSTLQIVLARSISCVSVLLLEVSPSISSLESCGLGPR